ncbi:MAG: rubredoxin [Gammaproteobacteria bacterium]
MSSPIAPSVIDGRNAVSISWECKICWTVYDPESGDEYWQIPAGTAFAELPSHWSCPNCGALKTEFLPIDG